jgi:uncharacterized protein
VKPSDINAEVFEKLLNRKNTLKLELSSQMRVQGGVNYIQFVDEVLHVRRTNQKMYSNNEYELILFDSLHDLYVELKKKESEYGLCRMVAGYSWPWRSKENKDEVDIEIEGLKFQWNQTDQDWINSPNAFKEIGCIHTTQGYDLNYTGVIFGKEISFNKITNTIEIDPKLYFDINGKKGVSNVEDLKSYIINIYKTIMYRGIKGTFIYACDNDLREYLRQYILSYKPSYSLRVLNFDDVKPYINSVPFVDIYAAAGNFSELQKHSAFEWVELPFNMTVKEGYFVCKVVGESMNQKIPNGSFCLFRREEGGTREGKIVLVESTYIQDAEFGSGYTVKEYHSQKNGDANEWSHQAIILKPLSNDSGFEEIALSQDELINFKVVGVFKQILA